MTAAPAASPASSASVTRVGVGLALLAALSFGTLGIWGKLAGQVGLSSDGVLAWRFGLVAAALLGETLTSWQWAGVAVTVAALVLFEATARDA